MSSKYYVYIGAYIKMTDITVRVEKMKNVCTKCDKIYTNGEKFCSHDGGEIEKRLYMVNVKLSTFGAIINEFDDLMDHDDELCSYVYAPGILQSNLNYTHITLGYDNEVVEITPAKLTEFIDMFNDKHSVLMKKMKDLGIKFEVKCGAIGFWS